MTLSIQAANIEFNAQGTPVATAFDDVYFSNANGLAETRYVFLQNNQLPLRWHDWQRSHFCIAETGFGTGLNFLTTWAEFERFKQQQPDADLSHLYFISVEKFPLSRQDLSLALQQWPELQVYAQQLLDSYPAPIAGCHRLSLANGTVTLDLWLGDLHDNLPKISEGQDGIVDAWYLDGFAPSKNPDMWTEALFQQMARLAKQNCTFATFTAAGFVKRGLQAAGFDVEKRKGFGTKRDMLAGFYLQPQSFSYQHPPYFVRREANTYSKCVSVIGGGMAAANLCYALAQKGYQTRLYCADSELATGASGNAQGGFYPQLHSQANIPSQFYSLAFSYAKQRYTQLLTSGYAFAHQWCGVLQLAFNANTLSRYQKMAQADVWPEELCYWIDEAQAAELANIELPYPGLFFPDAGWINPPQLVQALLTAADDIAGCEVVLNKKLLSIQHQQNWCLNWQDGEHSQADIVVLATGHHSQQIQQLSDFPYRLVRGQVESIPSEGQLTQLKTVLCHKGYLTPGYQQHHALGSTYIKQDTNCDYRSEEQQINLETHQQALANCHWTQQLQGANTGRASIRCSTPDHLPLAGAVADIPRQKQQYQDLYKALAHHKYPLPQDCPNLYTLTGLGSRGLCSAPLLAELVASQISGQPLPLADNLLNALNPNRYLVRELIRQQANQ